MRAGAPNPVRISGTVTAPPSSWKFSSTASMARPVTAVPFSIWILKGYYDTVPIELEEAARIDGCSQLEAFWRILLPLSVPALVVVFLFNFLTAWNDYFLARILLSMAELLTWPLGLQRFQQQFQTQWNELAAASILMGAVLVVLTLIQLGLGRRGEKKWSRK